MTSIAADRFLAQAPGWIDIATGAEVALVVMPAGTQVEQLVWTDECERLSGLRHPGLRPLLDFGAFDRTRRFEAYAYEPPLRTGRRSVEALRESAIRFLERRAVMISPPIDNVVWRPGIRGPATVTRWVGHELQPRSAYDAIVEALDAAHPPGVARVAVTGAIGSGLRTLRLLVARAARLAGYLPLGASVAHEWPELLDVVCRRHVCVLVGPDPVPDGVVERLAARAGAGSARHHLIVEFSREHVQGAVPVEPLGVRAMTAMVDVDQRYGLEPEEIARAVRSAGGWPGNLLSSLAGVYDDLRDPAVLVRETAPAYRAAEVQRPKPAAGDGRLATLLRRSCERGTRLARDGRHTAASRVLDRATRVLSARGARDEAAECAFAHAGLLLDRGLLQEATREFGRAGELSGGAMVRALALTGTGYVRLLENRSPDAEAAFRGAIIAAAGPDARSARCTARAGLVECLVRQGRLDEAEVALAGESGAPDAHLGRAEALVHLARGRLGDATRAATTALDLARTSGDARLVVSVCRTLATAYHAGGNASGALAALQDAIEEVRRSHLPLERLWLQIEECRIGATSTPPRLEALPPLLRDELKTVLTAKERTRSPADVPSEPGDLERFLELAQAADDDRHGLERVCAAALDHLGARSVVVVARPPERRLVALAGKPWPGDAAVARILSGESHVAVDLSVQPCFAAVAIRCGGEVLGALACRYAAGAAVHPARTQEILKAAALAIAPALRGTLERAPGPVRPEETDLIGDSPCMQALRDGIARAARAPFPILIQGESGSGKELVARAIHKLGPRRDRKFCAVNCAALTDDLLEAELFGHTRGAFTGAIGERPGLFEEADTGTLFLDEVGELSARAQAKLLRVLQDGEVRRIGENMSRRVDVRVIAATNRRLDAETSAGRFRVDLRFRLDVVRIEVPPLRERPGDIPLLAAKFWVDAAQRVGSQATLAPDTLAALARYDWPGNVRELQNVIAWMAVHSPRRGRIGPSALPSHLAAATLPAARTFEAAREEFERRFVRAALAASNGQRGRAADALGVSRQGLAKMIRRLGLDV